MRMMLTLSRIAVLFFALAAPAGAQATLSQSNDPLGGLASQMTGLLGQERAALAALPGDRLQQIVIVPTRAVEVQPDAPVTKPVPSEPTVLAAIRPEKQPGLFGLLTNPKPVKSTPPPAPTYDAAWLASAPKGASVEWSCLTKAVYFEARGESLKGQVAVAEVILNRAASGLYPRSICGVVNQGSRYACQFSFVCDAAADVMREPGAARVAGQVAALMMSGSPRLLTGGATHFHTGAVRPRWASAFARTAKIGSHYFYRQPMRLASN